MQPWPELPNIRVAVFFLDWKLLTWGDSLVKEPSSNTTTCWLSVPLKTRILWSYTTNMSLQWD